MNSARASSPPQEPPFLTTMPTPTPINSAPKRAAKRGLSARLGRTGGKCSQILKNMAMLSVEKAETSRK